MMKRIKGIHDYYHTQHSDDVSQKIATLKEKLKWNLSTSNETYGIYSPRTKGFLGCRTITTWYLNQQDMDIPKGWECYVKVTVYSHNNELFFELITNQKAAISLTVPSPEYVEFAVKILRQYISEVGQMMVN